MLHSFRARLALWHVVVLALVLGSFGLALSYSLRHSLAESVDRDLAFRANFYAERWGRDRFRRIPRGGPRSPQPPSGATESERRGYFRRPRIFFRAGDHMLPSNSDDPWDEDTFLLSVAGREQYSTVSLEGEKVRVYSTPILAGDLVEGVVQVAHPLTEQERLNDGLARTLLTLIPLALLVAGVGGAFLTDRALRPVRAITHAAAQIGAEDLSRRLDVPGKDELSELASTFNGMIGRLEEAFHRLESAYDQQRRFIADASHELRTPLTAIKANTSLALVGEPSAFEYREALTAADQAADSMNRIVQDLLLLARSDGGQLRLDLRPVPLEDVLRQSVALARRREGAPVHLDLPAMPLAVLGDAHHLTRLVTNLLENALRHTPADGEVTVTALSAPCAPDGEDPGPRVEVRIADTGEGMAPEHLPHLGERFYRVDSARCRAQGGTGLGLAICRSIVQAHRGSLGFESTLGRGTTVTVTLPGAAPPRTQNPELESGSHEVPPREPAQIEF